MKKIIGITAFTVLGMVALSSCKKDYTCTCTTDTMGVTSSASTTINATKSDAKEACEAGSTSSNVLGITSTSVCSID
jgi:hypothetical protein